MRGSPRRKRFRAVPRQKAACWQVIAFDCHGEFPGSERCLDWRFPIECIEASEFISSKVIPLTQAIVQHANKPGLPKMFDLVSKTGNGMDFLAKSKTYRYRIHLAEVGLPFEAGRAWRVGGAFEREPPEAA